MAAPLLEIDGVDKSFVGVHALRSVSLTMDQPEVLGVVGENGAGKSTLIKVLAGAYAPDRGTLSVEGKQLQPGPAAAIEAGISIIYQELSLVPDMSVTENLFLGRMPHHGPVVDRRRARDEARQVLARVGLADLEPDRRVSSLGLNVRQMVEIAKALARDAKVLVMDEPTAALQKDDIDMLFAAVRELRRQGVGVIYISHHLEEIFGLCDRAVVMRDGAVVDTRPLSDWTEDQLVQAMVARDLEEMYPWSPRELGAHVLDVQDLVAPPRVNGVSFSVRGGEILGIAGIAGAGRTEVLKCVAGALRPQSGTVSVGGRRVALTSTGRALRARIVYAPEDRKQEGLLLEASVEDNIALSSLPSISRAGVINRRARHRLASDSVRQFGIRTSSVRQHVGRLSGGNQQKVILGRVTQLSPKVILLDEPTRGIDVGAKAEIYGHILRLAERGAAVVLVSSELPELVSMCDRIAVMRQGRIVTELDRSAADQETVMRWATSGREQSR